MEQKSEKLTVNINIVDLGKMDLLINEGFYQNRTEFIKKAITYQLDRHELVINKKVKSKGMNLGVIRLGNNYLKKFKIIEHYFVVGFLYIPDDVDIDLLKEKIKKITVYGKSYASKELKNYYGLK